MKPSVIRQENRFYEFDSFLLNETERLLLFQGQAISLTPKAFELLLVFVNNAGLVLTKEELMERVWPDAFVEEANLAVNISMLRKVLGETPDGGQYIETLPRRGYRFAAEVKEFLGERLKSKPIFVQQPDPEQAVITEPDSDLAPASKPSAIPNRTRAQKLTAIAIASGILIAVAVVAYLLFAARGERSDSAQVKRLAVLPFRNQRPSEETDYLRFALADSVINKLDFLKSLVVRPSSYIEKYTRQEVEPQQAAKELDVNTLLMASYIIDGDDLIVNAQLIDVSSGEKLWSESFNVKNYELSHVQDYVARQVVKGLRLNLTPAEGERFDRNVSNNPVAYEYFLRSRYLMSTNNHRKAIELLTKAVEIDPNYAQAWAYLARAYHINALQFTGDKTELSAAEADYDQALELDPNLAETRLLKAKLFTETGRVEQAIPILLELMKAHPNMAAALWELSYAYRYAGLLSESIETGERALRLDSKIGAHQFNSYLYTGQYEKFINSLPVREDAYVLFYRGVGYYYQNDLNRAAAAFDRAFELNQSSVISQIGKALRFAIADKKREGLEILEAAEERIAKNRIGDGEITYKFAQAYDALGERAHALAAFNRSIEQGFFCYPYFASDPLLKNIRGEAEFAVILEKARQRHEDFKRELEKAK
ncbi:MAG TPA: winged helix-turn-helix domain-containing protein [Blastocatellia bacterium]|nr:winged helix-turn-helix domain-containing protein [Blastocatellia bacterium]